MPRLRFFIYLLIAVSTLGCSHRWDNLSVKPVEAGKKEVVLKDQRGKVLLLDFWATWCGPCRRLAPDIEKLNETYAKDGLMVLAITDEAPYLVEGYKTTFPHNIPYYTDEEQNAFRAFDVTGVPTLILIGKNGDLIARCDGYPIPADFVEKLENALK